MKKALFGCVAAVAALTAAPVSAASITVVSENGTTYQASSINDTTNGNDMVGMKVSAAVTRNGNQVIYNGVWQATGPSTGGVQWAEACVGFLCLTDFDDFGLQVSGDTFLPLQWQLDFIIDGALSTPWTLNYITFDGTSGNTVFDRFNGGNQGTAGSSFGWDFDGFYSYNGTIKATYSNRVQLNSAAPVGDVFTKFRLDFGNNPALTDGSLLGYRFTLDTDNATALRPVPEPTSLLLLGSALVGLAARLRRKAAR